MLSRRDWLGVVPLEEVDGEGEEERNASDHEEGAHVAEKREEHSRDGGPHGDAESAGEGEERDRSAQVLLLNETEEDEA